MENTALDWLATVGSRAFSFSLLAFVLLNGAALVAVFVTRDRTLVNRWTGRLLAANLVLAGTGLGIPILTSGARLVITVAAPAMRALAPVEATTGAEYSPDTEPVRPLRP